MKSVVLATDGSPSAAEATVRAVELAHALDATLVAVAVEHLAIPAYGYYGYADVVTELTKMENEHVDETLQHAKAVADEAGVPTARSSTPPARSPKRSARSPPTARPS